MAKDSPSTPAPPDPVATANAQATLNRYNVNTPYYRQTWQHAPAGSTAESAPAGPAPEQYIWQNDMEGGSQQINPAFTAWQQSQSNATPSGSAADQLGGWSTTYDLTPAGQATFEQNQALQRQLGGIAGTAANRVQDTLSQPFTPNVAPIQTSIDPRYDQNGQQVTDALMSRLQPSLDRGQAALFNQAINSGNLPGSAGYANAQDQYNRQANDARMQAVLAAGPEQQRQFNMGLASANLANAGRGQSMNEQIYQRNLPLNETSALMSGSQVQMPPISQQPTIDYSGMVNNQYLGQVANSNAQTAADNQFTGGLMSLAGTVGGAMIGGPMGASIGGAFGRGLGGMAPGALGAAGVPNYWSGF